MTDFKLDLSKLADDELPKPFWIEPPGEGRELKIGLNLHPQIEEIMAEMKRRGLGFKDGRYYKKCEPIK